MIKIFQTDPSRLIHLFWLGEDEPFWVSQNLKAWRMKYFRELNFWSDRNILDQGWDRQISKSWPKAMQVDYLRVLAVSKFGGWYVDADTTPLRRMFPQVDKVLLVREDGKRLWNGFFYAPSNHRFMIFWQNEIMKSIREKWPNNRNVSEISGPLALTRTLYTYALAVGVDKCRKEIALAPWNFVLFRKTNKCVSLFQNLYGKSSLLEHFGKATWLKNHFENKSFIGDFTFLLRQSPLSSSLDFIRNIMKHPRKFPKNTIEYKILRNLDNSVFDLDEPWEVHQERITSMSSLEDSMRNLKIGVFLIDDPSLSERLLFAGWKEIEKGKWMRPRKTELISKFKEQ